MILLSLSCLPSKSHQPKICIPLKTETLSGVSYWQSLESKVFTKKIDSSEQILAECAERVLTQEENFRYGKSVIENFKSKQKEKNGQTKQAAES